MIPAPLEINETTTEPRVQEKIFAHRIFNGLSSKEIFSILGYFKIRFPKAKTILEREGLSASKELFIIIEGDLELLRASQEKTSIFFDSGAQPFVVATITAGDLLGELSFLRDVPRSATIRVLTPAIVLSLTPEMLSKMRAEMPAATSMIMQNLLHYISERLKTTTDNQVQALTHQLEASDRTSKSNIFFSYVIGLLCLYNMAINLISQWSTSSLMTSLVSAGIILVFFFGCLLIIRQSKLPMGLFGLTLKNWKKSLRESMIWTAAIMITMLLLKWSLITFVPSLQGHSLIQFQPFEQKYQTFNFILYGMHSPIQEFIVRGVLQGSLQHFFVGRNVTAKAIVVSNALFAATHVHLFGGLLAILVFVTGLFWGWLYSRQQSLIGVSVSHILIGWWGLFILSFDSLL
jgi:CRP-like cAMP-binding protein/membrane protease YdiL (CAAX protease family)